MTRLAIVGFGLIGGSLGLAARAFVRDAHVTAIDRPEVLALAREREAAHTFVDAADRGAAAAALEQASLVVLAMPATAIGESVGWALEHAAVVTDCGSTKRQIVEHARRSPRHRRFVAGHPMAGLPHGGLVSARADLFRGSAWLLCPGDADADAIEAVKALVRAVGANPVHLDPAEHDAAVARTSHLPQLLASALLVVAGRHASTGAAGPAFERATRAAGGPESVWRDIFATNSDEVARAIEELCALLEPVRAELSRGEGTAAAQALLQQARRLRLPNS